MTDYPSWLDEADIAALKLAMDMACKDPVRKQQLEAKLQDENWHDVAEFAAGVCHHRNLKLKPWEAGPLDVYEDETYSDQGHQRRYKDAQRLLRKMLKAGVSRYHPDPMAALVAKKENGRRSVANGKS